MFPNNKVTANCFRSHFKILGVVSKSSRSKIVCALLVVGSVLLGGKFFVRRFGGAGRRRRSAGRVPKAHDVPVLVNAQDAQSFGPVLLAPGGPSVDLLQGAQPGPGLGGNVGAGLAKMNLALILGHLIESGLQKTK